jgi:hypothetical protein
MSDKRPIQEMVNDSIGSIGKGERMEDFETEIKDLDYMEHCSYKLQVG